MIYRKQAASQSEAPVAEAPVGVLYVLNPIDVQANQMAYRNESANTARLLILCVSVRFLSNQMSKQGVQKSGMPMKMNEMSNENNLRVMTYHAIGIYQLKLYNWVLMKVSFPDVHVNKLSGYPQ